MENFPTKNSSQKNFFNETLTNEGWTMIDHETPRKTPLLFKIMEKKLSYGFFEFLVINTEACEENIICLLQLKTLSK